MLLTLLHILYCLCFLTSPFIFLIFLVGVICIAAPERSILFSAITVLVLSQDSFISRHDLIDASRVPAVIIPSRYALQLTVHQPTSSHQSRMIKTYYTTCIRIIHTYNTYVVYIYYTSM